MNAVAKQETPAQLPTAALSESAALMSMIERAARDPSIDLDRMERLYTMHERAEARRAKSAFDAALAEMQPKLPVVAERGKIEIGGKASKPQTYALWEDINEAIKPVLAEHGFAISFRTGREDAQIIVTGILSHRDGHREETTMRLPLDQSGSKNAVQAVGSSTSYGKRYAAAALLNLTSRGEDDDGKAAAGKTVSSELITPEQVDTLQRRLVSLGVDIPKFYQNFAIERLEDLGVPQFGRAMQLLDQREKAAQTKDPSGTLRKQLQDSAAQSGERVR